MERQRGWEREREREYPTRAENARHTKDRTSTDFGYTQSELRRSTDSPSFQKPGVFFFFLVSGGTLNSEKKKKEKMYTRR